MTHNNIAYFHKYDWLCHLATFFVPMNYYKKWPSDKANHTCEICITLYVIQGVTKVTSWYQTFWSHLPVCNVASDCPAPFYTPGVFV